MYEFLFLVYICYDSRESWKNPAHLHQLSVAGRIKCTSKRDWLNLSNQLKSERTAGFYFIQDHIREKSN